MEAKVDHQQELKSLKLYEDEKRTVSLYNFALTLPHTNTWRYIFFWTERSSCAATGAQCPA